ncbi:hypothetical protein DYB37_006829 [Aphanomyces astaci]|uniref:Mediator of RNA polymerase II transcription subunit 10 n=1 Tax=Aphanomyces astaci TaxID=112090 RepID=A0A396ZMG2_APHAT|nr:hypothetical protein DYB25_003949 [Aphanomyces astaci]RHX98368.1 hypothetical protein DYB36_005504 [Aphanomyces astaci]RHY36520.1 hypothetical protein DYB34_001980 [Aphanomyces astaci]RHY59205.1 hypothetical protein DYB38_004507 [Aphanomyces astaci]RHY64029.1 hypothetical protein DYB30_001798 [Aphanomyces astaci]
MLAYTSFATSTAINKFKCRKVLFAFVSMTHADAAVHTYVQRLAELNLHLQHMPLNHAIPRALMAFLDKVPMENPEIWTLKQLEQCAADAAALRGKLQALQLLRQELRTGLGLDP